MKIRDLKFLTDENISHKVMSFLRQKDGLIMDIEVCLKEAVKKIVNKFNLNKIILFGSYAYGTPTLDSDIDLMVVMDTNEKPHRRAIGSRKLLKNLGVPKDIIVKTPDGFNRFKDIIGTIIHPAAYKGMGIYEKL